MGRSQLGPQMSRIKARLIVPILPVFGKTSTLLLVVWDYSKQFRAMHSSGTICLEGKIHIPGSLYGDPVMVSDSKHMYV